MNDRTAPQDDVPIPLAFLEQALDTQPREERSVGSAGPWPYLACPGTSGVDSSPPVRAGQRAMPGAIQPEREDVG